MKRHKKRKAEGDARKGGEHEALSTMEALNAVASMAASQVLKWPVGGDLDQALSDLLWQLPWAQLPSPSRKALFELHSLFEGKLGSDLFQQREPSGCDKLVAYLEGLTPAVVPVPTVQLVEQAPAALVDWEAAFFEGTEKSGTDHHLLSKLDEYAAEWDGGLVWQAPFAAVVQSSGWGKSWSICQLRSHGVFVVYCSLMKPEYTGYPRRSTVARCFEAQMSEALVCAYLRASLEVLAESDLSPEQWLECQIRSNVENVVGEAILQRHTALLPEMVKLQDLELKASLKRAMSAMKGKKKTKLRQGNLEVVFAFDECRGLKDFQASFPVLRKGLGHLPRQQGVFALLADTSASVSSFAPHRETDPTGRSRTHGQKLFDPIHLIGKADLFGSGSGSPPPPPPPLLPVPPPLSPVGGDDTSPSVLQRLEQLFSFGRPIWAVQYNNSHGDVEQRLSELVRFAAWKLLGGSRVDKLSDFTKVDAAAVFMACIGLEVLTRSYMAEQLVAGHMATCVATADERRQIITVHTSEAVLGEAASFILHECKLLVPALRFLTELVTEGLVLQGVRGELVMRIILLLCMHKCVNPLGSSTFSTGPVMIRTFLQTMFGASSVLH